MLRALAVGLLLTGSVLGQAPPANPVPAPALPPNLLTDPTRPAPPVVVANDPGIVVCQTRGSFDVLAGVFTGLRYQATLGPGGGPWAAEIYGGFSVVVLPTFGFGIRRRAFATTESADLLTVSPGLVGYALFAPWDLDHDRGTVGGAVVADVDFTWRHAFSCRFEGTLGLKVGAGVLFGRGGVLPDPVPVCSVFFGCGF